MRVPWRKVANEEPDQRDDSGRDVGKIFHLDAVEVEQMPCNVRMGRGVVGLHRAADTRGHHRCLVPIEMCN